MLKKTSTLIAAVIALITMVSFASRADAATITVYNDTPNWMVAFFYKDTRSPDWSSDLLTSDVPPRSSFNINLSGSSGSCLVDLHADLNNGREHDEYRFNTCTRSYWRIRAR